MPARPRRLPSLRATRWFLSFAAALIAVMPGAVVSFASEGAYDGTMPTPAGAVSLLMAGNRRFASGHMLRPDASPARRMETTGAQKPFAIILTCSDSRVPPELVFDQGLGSIFVIRDAGNVLDDHVIGSIEYAVAHLGTPLIVVVGHEKCGAVSAAVAGGEAPGHIGSIVESIAPAVEATRGKPGDAVDNAVRVNAQMVAAQLRASEPILAAAIKAGKLQVISARYDLETGRIEILPDLGYAPSSATVAGKPAVGSHATSGPETTPANQAPAVESTEEHGAESHGEH